MKLLTNSESSVTLFNNEEAVDNNLRMLDYKLNKKRTTAKLLRGAKRVKNLNVEVKSGCVNLRFSDGAYLEIVLPMLREWHIKVNEVIELGDKALKIVDFETRLYINDKHADTRLVIAYLEQNFTIHAYNTTQNVMSCTV